MEVSSRYISKTVFMSERCFTVLSASKMAEMLVEKEVYISKNELIYAGPPIKN